MIEHNYHQLMEFWIISKTEKMDGTIQLKLLYAYATANNICTGINISNLEKLAVKQEKRKRQKPLWLF